MGQPGHVIQYGRPMAAKIMTRKPQIGNLTNMTKLYSKIRLSRKDWNRVVGVRASVSVRVSVRVSDWG